MRKVLALVTGLFLLSMFAACSEDSTPTPPAPVAEELSIVTASVVTGYNCSPYNVMLEADGGTAPYTWSLAAGSLPSGVTLQSDGRLIGLSMNNGEYTFTARVEDSADTPNSVEREFTIPINEPSNPSLAIFFDSEASTCSANTTAWTWLTCYAYIMLEESSTECATACEFKLHFADVNGVDLDPGTEYSVTNTTTPSYVALTLGDLFNGMAFAFNRPQYGPAPILVASFDLLLLEDLDNLSFKFEANPGGSLGIASCDEGYPIVNVSGREAAINY